MPLRAPTDKSDHLWKRLRPLLAWSLGASLILFAGWGALDTHLERQRRVAESDALSDTAALARSYADHVARTVDTIDQTLLHTRFEWIALRGQMQLENLMELHLLMPQSHFNVIITDRTGMLLTSAIPATGPIYLGDRASFQYHKNTPRDALRIGIPEPSATETRLVIPFSRRISGSDRSFRGTVRVSMAPHYFSANYDEITLKSQGLLAVIGTDSLLRDSRIGPNPGPVAFTLPRFQGKSGSTLLDGTAFPDRRNRYVGWDKVPGYPLIALVGLDQQEALASYYEVRADQVEYAQWGSWVLAGFTLIGMGLSLTLARRQHQLDSAQTAYRVATEGGNEGFFIVDPVLDAHGQVSDFTIVDCNRRGAEFLRQRRENLHGKTFSALYPGPGHQDWINLLREAMQEGSKQRDIKIARDSPLTMRWVHLKIVVVGTSLALTLQDISETKAHVNELERRNNEDILTGLPNRHWIHRTLPDAIANAHANDEMLAVLFIDLDGFKAVNDSAGHAAGDELLRMVARRLKEAVRPHDHVARIGGDEFLVVLEQIDQISDASHVAERVLQAFHERFRIADGMHMVGTSIGISVFPADGGDVDTLLRHADAAMYAVKAAGKNSFRFYDRSSHDILLARLEHERALRRAIDTDQLVVHYQPRVDVLSGTTCGLEALVRWQHPTQGLLEPAEFIGVAEQTGMILDLGAVVIDKVCAQMRAWSHSGRTLLPVALNISPRQFNERNVAQTLRDALEKYQIDPTLIEVELTESSMMGESAHVAHALADIRQLGVKLLVDDFGTGYSSLSQLQRLDFDMLKVDRSFTAELGLSKSGSVFFKAIITMAHALGMRVIAEGVENESQIKVLKSLHCDEIQGFYLSRAVPPGPHQPVLPVFRLPFG